MSPPALLLLGNGETASSAERDLQSRLSLPFLASDPGSVPKGAFLLRIEDEGLTLYAPESPLRGGLRVDFTGTVLRRRARESLQRQDFGKALGMKPGVRPRVLDATGGFGTDAFLMASHGCEVTVWERSPLVFSMLEDGVMRAREAAKEDDELAAVVARLRLRQAEYAGAEPTGGRYEVVYLDPMFPAAKQAARAKKSMDTLQRLLSDATDEECLLARALTDAEKRVVVKRARLAPFLAGREADLSFRGRSNRFDVYFTGR